MLGYIVVPADAKAGGDDLLARIAGRLAAEGLRLAGAVQQNSGPEGDCRCDMDLRLLHDARVIRISQSLGPGATGCRLDADGLEAAAHAVAQALASGPDLLILNKFGKQEAVGRGMRPVVAASLEAGVPVLLAVAEEILPEFRAFTGDMAEQVAPEAAEAWARQAALAPAHA